MESILIHLKVPAIAVGYDLFAPVNLPIHELITNFCAGVYDLSGGAFVQSGFELLSAEKPEMLLNPNMTLADYSVPDGAVLILL